MVFGLGYVSAYSSCHSFSLAVSLKGEISCSTETTTTVLVILETKIGHTENLKQMMADEELRVFLSELSMCQNEVLNRYRC